MAFVTDIRTGGTSLSARFASWREAAATSFAQYRTYRTTLNELRGLTARELDDLGLGQADLETIAHEAAYS